MYDIYDLFRISLGERERGEWEREKERWKGRREEERRKETPSLSLFLSPSIFLPISLPPLEKRRGEEKESSEERSIYVL